MESLAGLTSDWQSIVRECLGSTFKPFFAIKVVSNGIVDNHYGCIEVLSTPGLGNTFRISPVLQDADEVGWTSEFSA